MDIYAPQALAQGPGAQGPPVGGCPGSCKWEARAAQEFVGCAGTVPARQSGLTAAPANMSLNKGKSAAPGAGGYNAMKGLTKISCPDRPKKTPEIASK